MTKFDLGIWSGVIFSTIPAIKVYHQYGLLAGIGAYIGTLVIFGLVLLAAFILMMVIIDKRKHNE